MGLDDAYSKRGGGGLTKSSTLIRPYWTDEKAPVLNDLHRPIGSVEVISFVMYT